MSAASGCAAHAFAGSTTSAMAVCFDRLRGRIGVARLTLNDAAPGFHHAEVSLTQRKVVAELILQATLTAEERALMVDDLSKCLFLEDDMKILLGLACLEEGRMGKKLGQEFRAFPGYLPEPLQDLLLGDIAKTAEKESQVFAFLGKLGLRNPNEPTGKFMTSFLLVHTMSKHELASKDPEDKWNMKNTLVFKFRRYARRLPAPEVHCNLLPTDPAECILQFPALYHNALGKSSPPSMKLDLMEIARLEASYTCRNNGVSTLDNRMRSSRAPTVQLSPASDLCRNQQLESFANCMMAGMRQIQETNMQMIQQFMQPSRSTGSLQLCNASQTALAEMSAEVASAHPPLQLLGLPQHREVLPLQVSAPMGPARAQVLRAQTLEVVEEGKATAPALENGGPAMEEERGKAAKSSVAAIVLAMEEKSAEAAARRSEEKAAAKAKAKAAAKATGNETAAAAASARKVLAQEIAAEAPSPNERGPETSPKPAAGKKGGKGSGKCRGKGSNKREAPPSKSPRQSSPAQIPTRFCEAEPMPKATSETSALGEGGCVAQTPQRKKAKAQDLRGNSPVALLPKDDVSPCAGKEKAYQATPTKTEDVLKQSELDTRPPLQRGKMTRPSISHETTRSQFQARTGMPGKRQNVAFAYGLGKPYPCVLTARAAATEWLEIEKARQGCS